MLMLVNSTSEMATITALLSKPRFRLRRRLETALPLTATLLGMNSFEFELAEVFPIDSVSKYGPHNAAKD